MAIDPVVLVRFLLTGVALCLALLAAIIWRRRKDTPEAATFALIVSAMAVYTFGYSGEVAQTSVSAAQRWLDIEYLALPWFPGLWLLAACRQNGIPVRRPLLFLIPVIVFLCHYTNPGDLFYTAPMTLAARGPFWVLNMPRGPISILDNAYLLVAFLAGGWIYLSGLRHASALFRRQAAIMLLGSQLPLAGYFVYLVGLSPWGLDITPITLAFSCVLFYYGIFRGGIFDLAPLARTLIFNSMRDAVLIVDQQDRLLDFNPAAQQLLPVLNRSNIGTVVGTLLTGNLGLLLALGEVGGASEITLNEGDEDPSFYEIRTWPLTSSNGPVGRALILADVTPQARLREELRRGAETDSLTGVANRRRFHHALEIECLRLGRSHCPLSLMMIDIDHFKSVNDLHGHPVGDAVLRAVTQRLATCVRKTDLLARYGGEEFAVLMPDTGIEGALVIAERIRQSVAEDAIKVEGLWIPLSISIGVASHTGQRDADARALLKEADSALYRAKAEGRNRVEVG